MATSDRIIAPSTRPEMNTGQWVVCKCHHCKDKPYPERGMHKPNETQCEAGYEADLRSFAKSIGMPSKPKKVHLNPGEKMVAMFEEAGFAWIAGPDGKLIQRNLS